MQTKTMWVALALVAVAWAPTASAGNCTNYGIHQEVNVGDKDCSYQGGNNYYQHCHTDSGAGAGAGAAATGPASGDPEASAGATAGGNCTQTQKSNQTTDPGADSRSTYPDIQPASRVTLEDAYGLPIQRGG